MTQTPEDPRESGAWESLKEKANRDASVTEQQVEDPDETDEWEAGKKKN